MPDFEETGSDDLAALFRRIKDHADAKAIRKELFAGLNRATKGVRAEMKEATQAPPVLPTRGGLQARVLRKQSVTTSARGGKWAGVSIRVGSRKGGIDLGIVHRTGRIKHPVFGNRNVWKFQSVGVQPRWMNDPFLQQKPAVQREVVQVMEEIGRKVEGR